MAYKIKTKNRKEIKDNSYNSRESVLNAYREGWITEEQLKDWSNEKVRLEREKKRKN